MKIVLFYHSLLSDWNHGNAHFLRGITRELLKRGHEVVIMEPENSWSIQNLIGEYGTKPIREFHKYYPELKSIRYSLKKLNLDKVLEGADLVLVHEWNAHELVEMIGAH